MTRLSFGVQSMVPHVLAALGRDARPASVSRRGRRWRGPPGSTTFNLDLIYGGAGESLDDWRADARRGARPRPAARQRLRPHRRAGHAAGRRPGPPPRRRRPGRQVPPRPTTRLEAAGLALVRDLELGPARPRVPAQPPLLEPGRLPSASAAPPTRTAPAGAGGTCARPSATSPPSTAGRVARGGRRGARRRDPAARGPAALAAHDGGRAVRPRCRTTCRRGSCRGCDGRAVLTVRGRLLANEVALRLV